MKAEELLRQGRLDDALAELQNQVRAAPAEPKHRTFLFQLMAVQGQWERAVTQLSVVAELDAAAIPMAQTYREAIRCELLRAEVFAGRRSPVIFGEPPEWIGMLIEALRLTADGQAAPARAMREKAFDAAPATSGTLDGTAFEWIADADGRLGPVLEAVVNGRYYWVPFENIAVVDLEEPEDLRDVVWMPAHFQWVNGGEAVGLIPTRYPGSESSPDEAIRLARRTEWQDAGEELFVGSGQRMLATDAGDHPLMDIRRITLDVAVEAAGSTPPSAAGEGA
ncbi:MAG: type VI secretion system accessory protein TagJ [Planctomycetota bacterium]|jgi:type VI secretion system protein ImpE